VGLEWNNRYAVVLAFDVKVSPEIRKLGEEMGVKIFAADIIYHLFDQMTAHMKKIKDERRAAAADTIVFPCVLEILEDHVYNKKDPIVVGVRIKEGVLKLGTPLCCPSAKVLLHTIPSYPTSSSLIIIHQFRTHVCDPLSRWSN
jgi:translation initiation factor 5B